ncbi:hypothetical protein [Proteiniphilum propionicum]|jgi:hypothetical protein|uniref:hypothetical protein n=1 Tax=Proteiniphilum propionicum TaxID=2829812 RepID=UPI001EECE5DE|nr:hypothetical protein [Proteiniphilum propionicum]ULB35640.1 hypothetical protein KDN43_06310 [Proteiniphilum propionicum]
MTTKKSAPKKEAISKPAEIIAEKELQISESEVKVLEDEEVNSKPIVLLIMGNDKLHRLAADKIVKHYQGELSAIPTSINLNGEESLVEKIVNFISTWENEEIILMDGIIPVNNFTRADVEAIYATLSNGKWNYSVHAPVLLERSKIVELLEEMPEIEDKDFVPAYVNKFHADKLPIVMFWGEDTFTLPIVSENPSHKTLNSCLEYKRWFWVSEKSTHAVTKYFADREV